jgi:hypothetical protein
MVFHRTLPLVLTCLFALGPQNILAQQKIPIELKTISEDTVGKRLVKKLIEDLQQSPTYELTSETNLPRLKLTIVTLDPYKTGGSTIYSSLMVASDVYLTDIFISSGIGVCGLGKIKDVAQKMVTDINNNLAYFLKAKKDWDHIGEAFKGERQKLTDQINSLENKVNTLDEQLKAEQAKSWWTKLVETIQSRFFLSKTDLPSRN